MIELQTALVRLAVAIAFGALIGIEREWRQKHAGLKTMTLVAIGAAAFAMLSDTFGPNNHNPGQIAAAVVGGIGFIGAGVIMHRGLTVQGVTTAATLWADASMGVSAGLGQYWLAIVITAGILLIQFMLRWFETGLHGFSGRAARVGRFELRVDCDSEAVHEVNEIWKRHASELGLTALRRSVQRGPEAATVRVVMRAGEKIDVSEMEETLVALDGVRRVDVRHLGLEDYD